MHKMVTMLAYWSEHKVFELLDEPASRTNRCTAILKLHPTVRLWTRLTSTGIRYATLESTSPWLSKYYFHVVTEVIHTASVTSSVELVGCNLPRAMATSFTNQQCARFTKSSSAAFYLAYVIVRHHVKIGRPSPYGRRLRARCTTIQHHKRTPCIWPQISSTNNDKKMMIERGLQDNIPLNRAGV
ncbi:hypothetical protein EJ02DRAFT_152198 [Clathrospora elynae]|uniref:Uncharacterized protein n=1 Tax=Clathrospora elynae TaxID=706981 RepID=A0A6A5STS9_9PLEO|nr:hypothetical protein EJ02DRAFT_152198 [Clathrospora elynae]